MTKSPEDIVPKDNKKKISLGKAKDEKLASSVIKGLKGKKVLKKSFGCSYCEKHFSQAKHAKRHERRIHTGEKQFAFKVAKDMLAKSPEDTVINGHKKKDRTSDHTNNENRQVLANSDKKSATFSCDLCNKNLTTLGILKRHVRMVHEKIKPAVCDICNKNFISSYHLSRHVRVVHEKIKPFNCQECGKKFGVKSTLTIHLQFKHKRGKDDKLASSAKKGLKVKKDLNGQLRQCKKCLENFASFGAFRSHQCSKKSAQTKRFKDPRFQREKGVKKCFNCSKSTGLNVLGLCSKCTTKLKPIIILPKIDNKEDVESYNNVRNIECDYCGVMFKHQEDLEGHNCLINNHDSSGIVSQDASVIVSQDASVIMSQDALEIVSQDASGIVSQDAPGIVSQDAPGIVTQDASGNVSQDSSGTLSVNIEDINIVRKDLFGTNKKNERIDRLIRKYQVMKISKQCRQCFKWFSSKQRRNKHITMLHKKSVTCEKCNVTFAETPDFVRHYKSFHKNSETLNNENFLINDLSQGKEQNLSKVSYQIASQEVAPGQMQNTLKEITQEVSQSTDVSQEMSQDLPQDVTQSEYTKTKFYEVPIETLVKESQNMLQDGSTDMRGQLSTAVPEHVSQDALVHVSQDMSVQVSGIASQNTSEIALEHVSGTVTQDASGIVSLDASESMSQDGTGPISQNASWYVSPGTLSQIASEYVSKDVSGIVSQDVSREVEETKDCSQIGLQRCDICSENFSDNDTYDTVTFQKHMKTVHQIDDKSYANSAEALNQPKHQENSTSSTIQQNTNVLVIFFFGLYYNK